jgi:hypothetical protein
MDTIENRRLFTLRLYLWLSVLFYLVVFWQRLPPAYGKGTILGFSGALLVKLSVMFIGIVVSAGLLGISYTSSRTGLLSLAEAIRRKMPRQPVVAGLLFVLLLAVYPLVWFSPSANAINVYLPNWWLFGHLVLLGSLFLHALWPKVNLVKSLVVTALVFGVVLQVVLFIPNISSYPLSLDWSEPGRFYNASTFVARLVYGTALPLPVLDASRALLQSIPFLIRGLPLWVHRLWEVLLWLGFIWAGGWALTRRIKLSSRVLGLLLTAWIFLFLFQGPIYYHLMPMVVVILLGFNRDHPWRSLVIVLLASVWAGLSRVNWFPMPGLLAATLYILETPLSGKPFWRYWLPPLTWVGVGTLVAFAVHRIYIPLSQNPVQVFDSSFSSPLLWYRLWPDATNYSGIVLTLAWLIFPVVLILLNKLIPRLKAWHPLRVAALAVILVGILGGGILVSVKIGGGNNLHNLDAFLVLLSVVAVYVGCDRFATDGQVSQVSYQPAWLWVVLAVITPLMIQMNVNSAPKYTLAPGYQKQLRALQQMLDQAQQQGGEVVFVNERQLVTFGSVSGVAMQPDYERVFLMEMAMSNNQYYLRGFVGDMKAHRYALVIFDTLPEQLKGPENPFADENNAWVSYATHTLLKYYQLKMNYPALQLSVLAPCPTAGCGGN